MGNVAGFVLDGLEVQNAPGTGVYLAGSNRSLAGSIRNCRFTSSGYSGLSISELSCVIENCYFGGNGGSGLIVGYGYGGGTNYGHYTVRNCIAENNADCGFRIYGLAFDVLLYWGWHRSHREDCMYAEISIDRCVSVGNGDGGMYVSAANVAVTNSIIAGNTGYPFGGVGCEGGSASAPVLVMNCTLADNRADASGNDTGGAAYCQDRIWIDLFWDDFQPPTYLVGYYPSYLDLTNCILSNNGAYAVFQDDHSAVTQNTNLIDPNSYLLRTDPDAAPNGLSGDAMSSLGRDNVVGDPAFVNRALRNYHLTDRSDAIDRGADVSLSVDLDGNPRPVDAVGLGGGGLYDIGAYEFQQSAVYVPLSGQTCSGELLIRWVPSRTPGSEVALSLWQEGQWVYDIASSAPNSGELAWPIPSGFVGRGFQVGIADTAAPASVQFGNAFSIVTPPALSDAWDAGGGKIGMTWVRDNGTSPVLDLAIAYDVYEGQFAPRGWAGTIWFPFAPAAVSGEMDVARSGGYHAWISRLWADGFWLPCSNPRTLIVYSGTPHLPSGLQAENRGDGVWRLHWNPEIYGTWLAQIIIYQKDIGWIAPLDGPSSGFPQLAPWTFVDYGTAAYDPAKASFLQGWADFLLPPGGPFYLFVNFRAWDGVTQGEFALVDAN
ncbi:MAG: right-handed parallel beta-helix repeat-containing protein [Candidatus Sumerlaeota bacterium]|nr:right-handed parallel beta-helix repeat-containing protein [Candidatus Sumerlaeota bacterium]